MSFIARNFIEDQNLCVVTVKEDFILERNVIKKGVSLEIEKIDSPDRQNISYSADADIKR